MSEDNYDYVNPDHYKAFSIEVIDMMVRIWGPDLTASHCEMCAFKYRMRMGTKPGQSMELDMHKVNWYLSKAKELRQDPKYTSDYPMTPSQSFPPAEKVVDFNPPRKKEEK